MCSPPACFETGFGFVSGFEEAWRFVEEFFKKIQKWTKLFIEGVKIYALWIVTTIAVRFRNIAWKSMIRSTAVHVNFDFSTMCCTRVPRYVPRGISGLVLIIANTPHVYYRFDRFEGVHSYTYSVCICVYTRWMHVLHQEPSIYPGGCCTYLSREKY
jgi:hypothetical protein